MMKKVKFFFLGAILSNCAISTNSSALKLFDFKTDVCTLFPNHSQSNPDQNWSHCCIAHDIDYWLGGPKDRKVAADQELKSCVAKTGAYQASNLMYSGVNIGGTPYLQTPWAWGFGWRARSNYSDFTERQLRMISRKMNSVREVINSYSKNCSKEQYEYVQKRVEEIKSDLSLSANHGSSSRDYSE